MGRFDVSPRGNIEIGQIVVVDLATNTGKKGERGDEPPYGIICYGWGSVREVEVRKWRRLKKLRTSSKGANAMGQKP